MHSSTTVNIHQQQSFDFKEISGKKLNTLFPESDPRIVTSGCNFFVDSGLFLLLINMVGRCPGCVAVMDNLLSKKISRAVFQNFMH